MPRRRGIFSSPLSLEEIARRAGLSRFHTLRLFKRAYGETPARRVARLRMERAKDLLATGEEPTTEIAFRPVNTGISAAGPRTVEHLPGNFQIVGGNSA